MMIGCGGALPRMMSEALSASIMTPALRLAESIMFMVLSANLIGDWLRVKLDPQLRQL